VFPVTALRNSGEIGGRNIIVGRSRRCQRGIGGLGGVIKGESMRVEIRTCLFLELWVPANKLIIGITGQVLEAVYRKSGKLLTSLIPLWMKIFTDGEKWD